MKLGAGSPGPIDQKPAPAQTVYHSIHYSRGAIVLHWLIAALVLTMIPLGIFGASASDENDAAQSATDLHKTVGIVILLLTVVRIGWRLTHRPPPLPESMARAYRRLIGVSHLLFYVLLIVMPLTGWWMSSALPEDRHPFGFGLFDVPFLPVPRNWASAGGAHFVHTNLAWLTIALVGLHIGGVLKHRLVDKDEILQRMLPLK